MDNRPIKGNTNGKYDMSFVDPTNDIASYYGGMTELQELVVHHFLCLGSLSLNDHIHKGGKGAVG